MTGTDASADNGKYSEDIVLEQRFWLRINRSCNNNCLFCHDSENQSGEFLPVEELEREIETASEAGYTRLILSGGEASIHPDFIHLVSFARKTGFRKIQTITNGRMFAYRSFTGEAVQAGLSEVTFSIHGHTAELHDAITCVPGSFVQAVRGLRNVQGTGRCVVNLDIVINRLNYKYIGDIIALFTRYGVFEYDLLELVPFGKAYENRKQLFFDRMDALPYLKPVFELGLSDRYYIWTNRMPAFMLEGYEQLIQDPHKMYDEIRGRAPMFARYRESGTLDCRSDRCSSCPMEGFCNKFIRYSQLPHEDKEAPQEEIVKRRAVPLQRETILELRHSLAAGGAPDPGSVCFTIPAYERLSEAREEYADLPAFLQELPDRYAIRDCAPCLHPGGHFCDGYPVNRSVFAGDGTIDLQKLMSLYILEDYFVKSSRCRECTRTSECRGMHINFIRTFGFAVFKPLGEGE